MSRILIDEDRCKGCLLCTQACPHDLLLKSERFNKQGYQVSGMKDGGESICTGCAFCATMCPDVAIRVFRTSKGGARS